MTRYRCVYYVEGDGINEDKSSLDTRVIHMYTDDIEAVYNEIEELLDVVVDETGYEEYNFYTLKSLSKVNYIPIRDRVKWTTNDIMSEEQDTIIASKLDRKYIPAAIAKAASR